MAGAERVLYLDTRNVGRPPGALADVHVAPNLGWISYPRAIHQRFGVPQKTHFETRCAVLVLEYISCQEGKIGRGLTKVGRNSCGELSKTRGRTCFAGPKHP